MALFLSQQGDITNGNEIAWLRLPDVAQIELVNYQPRRQSELFRALESPQWQDALTELGDIAKAQRNIHLPPAALSPYMAPITRLTTANEARVKGLIAAGERRSEVLTQALSAWTHETVSDRNAALSFLGLNLTMECNFQTRCRYCNQQRVAGTMDLEKWKQTIVGALPEGDGDKPYIYLTGGEPLLLGTDIWGERGLIRFAVERGCAVNLNTNATLITPKIALRLVQIGLSKVHVSLDTFNREVQDELAGESGRFDQIMIGITNLQLAREVLQADHPLIHINCVLNKLNLHDFSGLVEFLLQLKKIRSERTEVPIKEDPLFTDFALHAIPIGGVENKDLRPTKDEFHYFFSETWEEANTVWARYQETLGITPEERTTLQEHSVFTNPYLRVTYRGSLDDYCELAAQGIYSELGLCGQCYVGPCQAFVLPDGSQYWCGAHTISRPGALGNVPQTSVRENILRSLPDLSAYPNEYCRNCAGATLAINQTVEAGLKAKVEEWLGEADGNSQSEKTQDEISA